jgi:hypothetical protein
MRYDFRADRWPTDPNEAAVRDGDVFHALAMRGVAHHVALMIAERLEQGDTIEGVEVELVFEHGELEAQMKELAITATCTGGEPRKPFTVDLRPLRQQPWTRAVRRALINWGQPEDEATAIAERMERGETVEDVKLPLVTIELEELVVDQFESYGVEVTKRADG